MFDKDFKLSLSADNKSDALMISGVILGIVCLIIVLIIISCSNNIIIETPESCTSEETGSVMSFEMAKSLAQSSACIEKGVITNDAVCNEATGTWWISMNVEDAEGCSPACVVNVNTGFAEINWRCTGLVSN